MILNLETTKNNTFIIQYTPNKQRQEIVNEIWRKREEYINRNFNKLSHIILMDAVSDNNDSFLGNYDKETRRMQEKRCYATYINFHSLLNELKALTPLYNKYTIISFKLEGMSYDFKNDERCSMCPTSEIDYLDTHEELIGEPFTSLIRFLECYENNCRKYYIYNFYVELLPNKAFIQEVKQ